MVLKLLVYIQLAKHLGFSKNWLGQESKLLMQMMLLVLLELV
jgi:hypothetical protein